ncbi:MAG: aldehyde ferredoxin oxidoreductase N-terminal domain-containing protein [Dehalococcoidales bacterium]|nr:aldehyde ferredoxin oxidoreductase N-terminal domain-containing protein [Dehalococcoidales bacterium]
MTDWYGWAGNILNVDLTSMKVSNEELSPEFAAKYIGGDGFGIRTIYDEVGPEVDPLSPENVVVIGNGPLAGTITPGSSRFDVISKSPLTGIFARSNGSGGFGPEMKFAGYDLIVIRGKAEKPVYLWLNDGRAEIRDAAHLWGKDTWTTDHLIQQELNNSDIHSIKIGPSGENLGFSSAIIGDLGRAAGRMSLAAVWGSKNLKAVAALGNKEVKVARPKEFMELCQSLLDRAKRDPMYTIHTNYGTTGWVSYGFYTKRKAELDAIHEKILSCFGCAYHCRHFNSVKSGKYAGTAGPGFEGGPLGRSLNMAQVDNVEFFVKANTLCNQLGVHVQVPFHAFQWAIQLYRDGIITKEDTEGLEITPGNEEVFLELLHKIAYKEGFGEILDGYPIRSAEKLGRGSDLYISHGKGHTDHGWTRGMGGLRSVLGNSVATRGYDHLTGAQSQTVPGSRREHSDEHLRKLGEERYGDPEAFFNPFTPDPIKAREVYDNEITYALCDMTGVCHFASHQTFITEGMHDEDFAQVMSAATGIDFSVEDMRKAAERKNLMERAFNAREGIRRIDDYPYPFHYQLKHGKEHPRYDYSKFEYNIEDFDKVLDEYYRLRGCDLETGIPTRGKLESIGLDDVANDLAGRGILPG